MSCSAAPLPISSAVFLAGIARTAVTLERRVTGPAGVERDATNMTVADSRRDSQACNPQPSDNYQINYALGAAAASKHS